MTNVRLSVITDTHTHTHTALAVLIISHCCQGAKFEGCVYIKLKKKKVSAPLSACKHLSVCLTCRDEPLAPSSSLLSM